ncbi:hypothetical protein SPMU_24870 [Sphingomonas mucosissima]|uniref:Uncharacterized protein n=1 Tax=Sphingomonas mucosissima TaxID=370959 RepID=A0A245ZGT7_9SPHN|nr:hypothetical protein SPMU_24870 [Sphingomonas mucosissima]
MAWVSDTQGTLRELDATPAPRRYRAKIDTVGNVSRELSRVYREARSGMISVEHASKYANILSIIARILETSNLEVRLAAIEAAR